jgi:hypothetical protein
MRRSALHDLFNNTTIVYYIPFLERKRKGTAMAAAAGAG